MLLLLLLLAIVPVAAYRYAKHHRPRQVFLISGMALGSVVAPLSLGLYATFFIPYVGLFPGILGLIASTVHGVPGHTVALYFGIIPPQVVEGVSHIYLGVIDAMIWATVYGCFGWVIDRWRLRRRNDG
jgi:hypothetical protein